MQLGASNGVFFSFPINVQRDLMRHQVGHIPNHSTLIIAQNLVNIDDEIPEMEKIGDRTWIKRLHRCGSIPGFPKDSHDDL